MAHHNIPDSGKLQELEKVALEAAQVGAEILQKYAKAGFQIEQPLRHFPCLTIFYSNNCLLPDLGYRNASQAWQASLLN